MYSTSDFRRGLKIEMDGKPYEIVDFQHVKPGKGGAFVRTKLKHILNGRVVDQTFRSGEKVDKPDIGMQDMQYLYKEGDDFVFMDMESYEQKHIPATQVGEKGGYIKEGETLKVLLYNGELFDMELPASVVLEIIETEPGVQGDRVTNANKPAKMETGIMVNVPLFIAQGERIKVDTRTGTYISRDRD
ncbi:MAG: elongation factor P [Deltaproteobacteria bacterium HGW-Deltaproteobacteria-8]|jgi:elongation factor P|nr:MAG: elongation factor P [Deltaproteobacteria bacterium HGW-Deltaproteobacteria-8]